jgi:uncharacterized protein (TIGR03084 family)
MVGVGRISSSPHRSFRRRSPPVHRERPTAGTLSEMEAICADLALEYADLDHVLESAHDWGTATAAEGWSVADTVSHLWFFDQRALLALTDVERFADDAERLMARGIEASIEPGRSMGRDELWNNWRHDRSELIEVARGVDPGARIPWYGPSMGARSFITARLMETWAHGQDVVDVVQPPEMTLGDPDRCVRPPSARLRHIAHIGVRARPYSYLVNGRQPPESDVHVRLTAPDGDVWEWGDPDCADAVGGSALEFCLVVTQRRHLDDVALDIVGASAREWMGFAQAFAGPAGPGRSPLNRR